MHEHDLPLIVKKISCVWKKMIIFKRTKKYLKNYLKLWIKKNNKLFTGTELNDEPCTRTEQISWMDLWESALVVSSWGHLRWHFTPALNTPLEKDNLVLNELLKESRYWTMKHVKGSLYKPAISLYKLLPQSNSYNGFNKLTLDLYLISSDTKVWERSYWGQAFNYGSMHPWHFPIWICKLSELFIAMDHCA